MTVKTLLKKYGKYIERIEMDSDEWFESFYGIYLKEPYKTDSGSSQIHDSLDIIEVEMKDIKKRYN